MPYPRAQIILIVLLLLLGVLSVWTVWLCVIRPVGGRFFEPARWAGTVAGLAVCAAFFQVATTKWFAIVLEFYSDADRFPSGPPSHIARKIIENPDTPIRSAFRNYVFFDPSLGAVLGLWAGIFTILSYWID